MAKSKVTIADVAQESGVSQATVSLVLRDKAGVGAETRQRVLDTAQRLGYLAKSSSSSFNTAVSTIGVIIKARPNDIPAANNFYAPVLAGIESVCRRQKINMLYANMPVDEANVPLELPRLLSEQSANGFLFVGEWLHHSLVSTLKTQNLPTVLVDAYADGNPFDAVVTDNVRGAYTAVSHLIQKGHQQIAIVGSQPDAYPSIRERREGYLQALEAQGLSPHFVDCALEPDLAVPAAAAYLTEHEEVTAVFACNDDVAMAVMQVAAQLGKAIPQDLAVVGFDNLVLAQHTTPPLTTMRVDKAGMGRLSTQLLLNRIEFPQTAVIQAIIHPHLIERETT